jgi:curved DNA-binding protein CbpA
LQSKDYYKILHLPPSASLKEIKAAYRRLAHQYHPDKNSVDPYSREQFELVKEAYEVLSNPSKKEYYLQQRWYDQVMNRKQTATVIEPVTVLKQVLELNRYVMTLDVHRMDKEGLYQYICDLLADETIVKLNAFNEKDINGPIIESVLKSGQSLPWKHARPLSERLMKLNTDPAILEMVRRYLHRARQTKTWNKYRIWLLLLIVAILCLLIYRIGD